MFWKLRKIIYKTMLRQLLCWICSNMQSEKKSWIKGKRSLAGHPSQRSTKDLQSLIILTSLTNIKLGNIAKKSSNLSEETSYELKKCCLYSRRASNKKIVILGVLKNKTYYKTERVTTRDFVVVSSPWIVSSSSEESIQVSIT